MTAEPDLLQLPEPGMLHTNEPRQWFTAAQLQAYARANVAHAVAPLQAEIEELRAEVNALREALEGIRSRSTMNLAMRPDLFALAASLGYIYQVADALLRDQEEGHEQ